MKVTLRDGREITIDLYALTVAEMRSMTESYKKDDQGDGILSKAIGLTPMEIQSLSYPDFRKIIKAFWEAVRDPLKDDGELKNSPSESSSPPKE